MQAEWCLKKPFSLRTTISYRSRYVAVINPVCFVRQGRVSVRRVLTLSHASTAGERLGLDEAGFEVDVLARRKGDVWVYIMLSILFGAVFVLAGFASVGFIPFGIIAFAVGGVLYGMRLEPVEQALTGKRRDLAVVAVAFDSQIEKMSEEIFQQLSEVHEAKVRPKMEHIVVDFARILEAARGRGIVLDTIECPSCKASITLPDSGDTFQCEHCGKSIRATDIFEKLKIPLRQIA